MMPVAECHPSLLARALRAMRAMRNVRGWNLLLEWLVPFSTTGPFRVRNDEGVFEGDIGTFIDRTVYFDGGFEADYIAAFLGLLEGRPRRVALDIGANIGTHSLAFSAAFDQVISFEPNPLVYQRLLTNLALNPGHHVLPQPIGLGAQAGTLPFFDLGLPNDGLGTFQDSDQYGMPLREIGQLPVARGDDVLSSLAPGKVDAIKIDVQGFELDVLAGLQQVLAADTPMIWIEISEGTHIARANGRDLGELIPFPFEIHAFATHRKAGHYRIALDPLAGLDNFIGDAIIIPR